MDWGDWEDAQWFPAPGSSANTWSNPRADGYASGTSPRCHLPDMMVSSVDGYSQV